MREDYKKLTKEWLKRANNDFLFAKAGFEETGIAMDTCFLVHQSVEKYLKGYLVDNNIEPERSHVLPRVLKKCIKMDDSFSQLEEGCEFLNKFYQPSRYPGGVILDFTKDEAEESLKIAKEIIDFIKQKVKL